MLKFTDPELQKHYESIRHTRVEGVTPEIEDIFHLMEMLAPFGHRELQAWPADRQWRPASPQLTEIFAKLTAPENRTGLRKWYAMAGENINPTALATRDLLSDMIGEELRPPRNPNGRCDDKSVYLQWNAGASSCNGSRIPFSKLVAPLCLVGFGILIVVAVLLRHGQRHSPRDSGGNSVIANTLSKLPSGLASLPECQQALSSLLPGKIRTFSTYDFGREKDPANLSLLVPKEEAKVVVSQLRKRLGSGLVTYVGSGGEEVVIGKGSSQFDILRLARTDAANYDMLTEDLIKKLQDYHEQVGIDIYHAESDTIEFRLLTRPKDMAAFARDLYKFCPDIVDQGCESVEALEAEVKQRGEVFLWWD